MSPILLVLCPGCGCHWPHPADARDRARCPGCGHPWNPSDIEAAYARLRTLRAAKAAGLSVLRLRLDRQTRSAAVLGAVGGVFRSLARPTLKGGER